MKTPDQARWWIEYWQEMRGVPPGMFTLAEYLPGRDITVQCIFKGGRLYIAKMLHRLAYNVIGGAPSGISSTASLGKMIHEPAIVRLCVRAVTAVDPKANGAFSVDLRENAAGKPCITEINAGRFANGPVVHDLAGEPSTVLTYVRLALGQRTKIIRGRAYADENFIMLSARNAMRTGGCSREKPDGTGNALAVSAARNRRRVIKRDPWWEPNPDASAARPVC